MKEKLEKINGQRIKVQATFKKFGKIVSNYQGRTTKTVLFVDIKDEEGNSIADHLWFKLIKGFDKLDLQEGEVVSFSARVSEYEKGYRRKIWISDNTEEEFKYYKYCCEMVGYDEENYCDPNEFDDEYDTYKEYYDFINYYENNGHYEMLDDTELDYKLLYPTNIKKLERIKNKEEI